MNNLSRVIWFGVLGTAAAVFAIYSWSSDPMNSHGLGLGWECSALGRGAVACDKDVPISKPPTSAAQQWVVMEFKPNGVAILDGHATSVEGDLAERLNNLARRNPRPRIWLTPSKLASYADVARALSLVQRTGLQINMTGISKSGDHN